MSGKYLSFYDFLSRAVAGSLDVSRALTIRTKAVLKHAVLILPNKQF